MLFQIPRLTSSLREPFDVDQAYLHRKLLLQNHKPSHSIASLGESELARKIVYQWDEASFEVRQAYKHFIAGVVGLVDREVPSEELGEVALTIYCLFGEQKEENDLDYIAKNIQGITQLHC